MLEGWRRRRQNRREWMGEMLTLESALRDLSMVTFDDPRNLREKVMRIAEARGERPSKVARDVYLSIIGG